MPLKGNRKPVHFCLWLQNKIRPYQNFMSHFSQGIVAFKFNALFRPNFSMIIHQNGSHSPQITKHHRNPQKNAI